MTHPLSSSLGFVVPVIPKPLEQTTHSAESCAPSEPQVPQEPPRLIYLPQAGEPLPIELSQLPEPTAFSQQDRKDFINFICFFASDQSLVSASESSKMLELLTNSVNSVAFKTAANVGYFENAGDLAKKIEEAAIKMRIGITIAKTHPYVATALSASVLAEILRPRLEEAMQRAQAEKQGEFSRRNILYSYPFLPSLSDLNALLQIATIPARLLNSFCNVSTETLNQGGIHAAKGLVSWCKGYVGNLERIERENAEKSSKREEEEADSLELENQEQQTDTQESENREIPLQDDQTRSKNQVNPTLQYPITSYGAGIIKPPQPHPITEHIGLGFSVDNSRATKGARGLNYRVQVSIPISGAKQLSGGNHPGPGGRLHYPGHGSDSGTATQTGMRAGGDHLGDKFRRDWNSFVAAEKDWIDKGKALNEQIKSFSPDDSLATEIDKHNKVCDAAEALWQAEEKLGKRAVNFYKNQKNGSKSEFDKYVTKVLYDQLHVPRCSKHMEEKCVAQSSQLQSLKDLKQWHSDKRASLEVLVGISSDYQQFCSLEDSIKKRERSDGPINLNEHERSVADLETLAKKMSDDLGKMKAYPQDMVNGEKLKAFEENLVERLGAIKGRHHRYEKLISDYEQISSDNRASHSDEGLTLLMGREEKLACQMREFMEQCPAATELSARLKQVELNHGFHLYSAEHKKLAEAYQKFGLVEDSLIKMEQSDESIDLTEFEKARKQLLTLYEQMRDQFHTAATSSLKDYIDPQKIETMQKQIQQRYEAILRRDFRYAKIKSDYDLYCAAHRLLLSQFLSGGNDPETLLDLARQKERLEREMEQIMTQCPESQERNATILLIQGDLREKYGILSFSQKSLKDQYSELSTLREQITSPSDCDQSQGALSAYNERLALLSLRFVQHKEFDQLSHVFSDFLIHLKGLKSLAPSSIDLVSLLSSYLVQGIQSKKVTLSKSMILDLEALEKQHSSESLDLKPLAIAIGKLVGLSDNCKDKQARERYLQCQKIEPSNPDWANLLALAHMETLEWARAGEFLLEAQKIDPQNKETEKLVSAFVKDQFQIMTQFLEWVHALSSVEFFEEKESLSLLQRVINACKEAIHTSTTVFTHPSLLKQWLPEVLPTQFKEQLRAYLNEDKTTDFNLKNTTTLVTRIIPIVTSFIEKYGPKQESSLLVSCLKPLTLLSQRVQQLINGYESICKPYELYSKYCKKELTGLDCVSTTSQTVLEGLPWTISVVQKFSYKDDKEKRVGQRNYPSLHALVETVASKQFSSSIMWTFLTMKSRDLIRRCVARVTGLVQNDAGNVATMLVVLYQAYQLHMQYFKEKEKIVATG